MQTTFRTLAGHGRRRLTAGFSAMMVAGISAALLSAGSPRVWAQTVEGSPDVAVARVDLPDAPGYSSSVAAPVSVASFFGGAGAPAAPRVAGRYDKVILPGQTAPRLTVHDKAILGVKDAISPFSAIGWVISAGYEQATNGSPNYPQTGTGFAQRLGAAAARDTSETIFDESILAPILHEDPRYYKLGSGNNFFKRAAYAATRPVITRTDGGHSTINFAEIGGNLGGSAVTQLYYPALNRNVNEVLKTWGGSIGGDALSYLVSEFLDDTLEAVHLKKTTR